MNRHIENAYRALGQPDVTQVEERVIDLLTDLIHLCHDHGYDWERMVDLAEDHYEQEEGEQQ